MWLFTKTGYFSIIRDLHSPDFLCVRSRVAGDLELLVPRAKVTENRITDYRYRARVPAPWIVSAVAEEITWIDYDNFKGAIRDPRRSRAYNEVWKTLAQMQEEFILSDQIAKGEDH